MAAKKSLSQPTTLIAALKLAKSRTDAILAVDEAVTALCAPDLFGPNFEELLRKDSKAYAKAIAKAQTVRARICDDVEKLREALACDSDDERDAAVALVDSLVEVGIVPADWLCKVSPVGPPSGREQTYTCKAHGSEFVASIDDDPTNCEP